MGTPIRTKRNPEGWRWKLVLWLTKGRLEAVPVFHQDVSSMDGLSIMLGRPGGVNVAVLMDHTKEGAEGMEVRYG